jgi:hypothetical protein
MRVLPAEEAFTGLNWANTAGPCGNGITAEIPAPGGPLDLKQGSVTIRSFAHATAHAFTKDGSTCRGAVVPGPPPQGQIGNTSSVVNLGFAGGISAGVGQHQDLGLDSWEPGQFKVSPDAGLVIAVELTSSTYYATVRNMLGLFDEDGNRQYDDDARFTARVVGANVEGTRSIGTPSVVTWSLL